LGKKLTKGVEEIKGVGKVAIGKFDFEKNRISKMMNGQVFSQLTRRFTVSETETLMMNKKRNEPQCSEH